MKNIFYINFLSFIFFCTFLQPVAVSAQQTALSEHYRLLLARSFVSKLKSGLQRADNQLHAKGIIDERNVLPDGEMLLLQPVLAKRFFVDGIVLGLVKDKKILLSLRDVSEVLQLPISVDAEKKMAQGWYIREEKEFLLDVVNRLAKSDVGEFKVSDNVIVKDNDIWVPTDELGSWIDFEFKPVISVQELRIASSVLLPIQERYNRRMASFTKQGVGEAKLPRGGDSYRVVGEPFIDVATSSFYRKNGNDEEGVAKHNVNIRTAGDFAYGTLTTQTRLNNDNQLSNVRVTYKRESDNPDLLGALKARRFDIGDVITTRVPLGGQVSNEMGVRVTNTDSLRTFTVPRTGISGTAFPGWDVELYRENQIVAFQEVGEDGFYNFEDVDLYVADNNFKLIFYGPQGEVREESLFVPVNQSLGRAEGVYDVSVSLNKKNTYNNKSSLANDIDEGSLNIAAYYEKPVLSGTTVSAGLWSSEHEGVRNSAANIGFSTTVAQTLINGGLAVDDDGDMAGELSFRRDFGLHEFRNSLNWKGADFDTQLGGEVQGAGALYNNLRVSGPLPWGKINTQKYNLGVNYYLDTNSDYSISSSAGISSSIKNISLNQQFQHKTGNSEDNDTLSSYTNITGSIGKNRLRFGADYLIEPDSELRSVLATYRRSFTKKVNMEMGVVKRPQRELTEYSAKLDWQAGFVRISPSIRYNSEQDFFAGLNTRFGVLKDPARNNLKIYDINLTNSGAVSVFVYLDKDGDGKFNGDDEPLEGIVVKAPQNGGRKVTDKNGVALFNRMGVLKLTDIFLDNESLQDPTWVNSFEGVSILPREGYVAEVNFPIHISGEIDGSVYARAISLPEGVAGFDVSSDKYVEPEPIPLRNIRLNLYNDRGMVEKSVVTDASGFYYFSQVPPGRYFLIIDEKSAKSGKFIRPEPQQIEIGYDGTVIYSNNLYVDMGGGDIPNAFLPDLDDYKSRHPHIDFSDKNNDLVLNLGEFNSRFLMSIVWYKIRSRYGKILEGGELFVPPAQSYADVKTGKHTLRIGLKDQTLDQAYDKCRALMAREQYCKVEIYPSYMKHAKAVN